MKPLQKELQGGQETEFRQSSVMNDANFYIKSLVQHPALSHGQ